ncbi:coiled-coil domain-containing protein 178 [Thomomys bottae]
MPEKDTVPNGPPILTKIQEGKTCEEIKAIRESAKGFVQTEYGWMLLNTTPKVQYFDTKTTNTEEVGKGVYFGYPSRRHSCSQVNIPAPCVTKTISHIEDVESKIYEHLKQFETSLEEWSRISYTKCGKKVLTVAIPVKGVKPEDRRVSCPELKEKMRALLSETINLIQSLETDRALAELALKQQKSRRKKISMRIDSWSIWKIQELPLAVQREHDAYMKDIIELRWHLEDRGYQAKNLQKRKEKFDEANTKIEEDIKQMIENTLLLTTKQKQQDEALRQEYVKKTEALDLLQQVKEELENAKQEYEDIKSELQLMRVNMDQTLFEEEVSIQVYKKEIDKLKHIFTHYTESIDGVQAEMKISEEAVSEILKESQSTTSILNGLNKSLDDLKREYEKLFRKKNRAERDYLETLNDYYATKRTWDSELSNVIKDYKDLSTVYAKLVEENKKIVIDTDTMIEKINESIAKKTEYEKEIQTLLRNKKRNSVYIRELYEESYHIGTTYAITKHKTEEMESKMADVRRKFKVREDFLKKLTQGEIAAGIVIQKRLFSIEESLYLERKKLVHKKILFTVALDEVETPLMDLEGEAVRIRVIHREQYDVLNDILQKRNNIRTKVEKTKKKLHKKEKKSRVALSETVEKRSIVYKELEDTICKTIIYNEKVVQMSKELINGEEVTIQYDQELEVLRKQFYDVKFERDRIQTIYDHLLEEKTKCNDRLYEESKMFRRLVDMRQRTLASLCKTQDDLLEENYRLAQKYQKAQIIYLKEKDSYFSMFDRQLSLHTSVKDKKQQRRSLSASCPCQCHVGSICCSGQRGLIDAVKPVSKTSYVISS